MSVTDSDEVFVARLQMGGTMPSSSANTAFFTSRFSKTASMTKSASANDALSTSPVTGR